MKDFNYSTTSFEEYPLIPDSLIQPIENFIFKVSIETSSLAHLKKSILLSFRINKMEILRGPYTSWYDKVPGKSVNWKEEDWKDYYYIDDNVYK